MNLGPYRFSPPILAILATLFLFAIFAGLGRWQLDRMHQKEQITAQHQQRQSEPQATALPPLDADLESWRYRRVRLSGEWLGERQFLLDNQVLDRQVGFNVLTPLVLDDGRTVLVDRGWVALGLRREDLPDVRLTTEIGTLEGTVYVPFGEPLCWAASCCLWLCACRRSKRAVTKENGRSLRCPPTSISLTPCSGLGWPSCQ